jgi:hypothetical protein
MHMQIFHYWSTQVIEHLDMFSSTAAATTATGLKGIDIYVESASSKQVLQYSLRTLLQRDQVFDDIQHIVEQIMALLIRPGSLPR